MSKEKMEDQVFDVDRIRSLIELMKEHDLSEIDLRQAERRIKLRRGLDSYPLIAPPAAAVQAPAARLVDSKSVNPADSDDRSDDAHEYIVSPTVGTFYSKPKPDAKPFVNVGDVVSPETIVCLVEAMKMYNEIPAGVSGKIIACLVKNEEPVDVNRRLFKVALS
jgi:acetyl-CoA carboxylase biotin carboxyl carrier protein